MTSKKEKKMRLINEIPVSDLKLESLVEDLRP